MRNHSETKNTKLPICRLSSSLSAAKVSFFQWKSFLSSRIPDAVCFSVSLQYFTSKSSSCPTPIVEATIPLLSFFFQSYLFSQLNQEKSGPAVLFTSSPDFQLRMSKNLIRLKLGTQITRSWFLFFLLLIEEIIEQEKY